MATTPTQAIPYAGPNDAPDVPYWMQRMAERIAALLDALGVTLGKAPKGLVGYTSNNATSIGLGGGSVVCDYVQVDLVKDRMYRATWRVNTVCQATANMAIAVAIKKSATSDVTNQGLDLDDAHTIYTAPVANQGCTSQVSMTWRATATERVNIKAIMARASGTATFDISARKLAFFDDGAQI